MNDDKINNDYDYSRETLYELIEKGIGSMGARKKLIVVRQDCIASDLRTYLTLLLYSQAFEEARKQISEDEKKSV